MRDALFAATTRPFSFFCLTYIRDRCTVVYEGALLTTAKLILASNFWLLIVISDIYIDIRIFTDSLLGFFSGCEIGQCPGC